MKCSKYVLASLFTSLLLHSSETVETTASPATASQEEQTVSFPEDTPAPVQAIKNADLSSVLKPSEEKEREERLSVAVQRSLDLMQLEESPLAPFMEQAIRLRLSQPLNRQSVVEIAFLNNPVLQRFLDSYKVSMEDLRAIGFIDHPTLQTLFCPSTSADVTYHSKTARFMRILKDTPGKPKHLEQEAVFTSLYHTLANLWMQVQKAYNHCLLSEARLHNGIEIERVVNDYLQNRLGRSNFGFSNSKVTQAARHNLDLWELEIERLETHARLAKRDLCRLIGVEDLWEDVSIGSELEHPNLLIENMEPYLRTAMDNRMDLHLLRLRLEQTKALVAKHEERVQHLGQDLLLLADNDPSEKENLQKHIEFKNQLIKRLEQLSKKLELSLEHKEHDLKRELELAVENIMLFQEQYTAYKDRVIPAQKSVLNDVANRSKANLHPGRSFLAEAWTLIYHIRNQALSTTKDCLDSITDLEHAIGSPLTFEWESCEIDNI
ncbi:MAG: hypothetical protein CMO81_07095 [Waddliaceae bacterium]|nr:hypothetical protein [Waddliaceae bacterium]